MNMKNLNFFNKNGDSLNFTYNNDIERYEGDILFDIGSSDTYKEEAIYLFENIKSFEFENIDDLSLKKFQLFNEYGFHFYNSVYIDEVIVSIEPVNIEPTYYSKWIYGSGFDSKFPIGTLIRFNQSIFEFTNINQLYTVVSVKKDSIMILSNMLNDVFDTTYTWNIPGSYNNETISSVNIIGVYNYIDTLLNETLSPWNEPDFYNRLYIDRKLNIVNTKLNDSYSLTNNYEDVNVVTIKNVNIQDIVHFEYKLDSSILLTDLVIEVVTKTDLPLVYSGQINIFDQSTSNPLGFTNVIDFTQQIPLILKPGIEFKIINSVSNTTFITVSDIPNFLGNANQIDYVVGNQVIWNNRIYECILDYTWVSNNISEDLSGLIPITTANPDNDIYWGYPSYLSINESLVNEIVTNCDIYLTSDHLYFNQSFTFSSGVTLASAAQRYKDVLDILNIDLYYKDNFLHADLIHPSEYAIVNFYAATASIPYIIGTSEVFYERAIETEEDLVREYNYEQSENFNYTIVFTDVDTYGILFNINGLVYQTPVIFNYSFGVIDMERSIDATLRNWYVLNAADLLIQGIIIELQTVDVISPFFNSIGMSTQYPNIPLYFEVEVGTTAEFFIQHSSVIFYQPSFEGLDPSFTSYLDIIINNRSYPIEVDLSNPISTTLQNWVETYIDIINDYNIYVSTILSVINFNVKDIRQRCVIDVKPGVSVQPGDYNWLLINKIIGNKGPIITSNEILLGTQSIINSSYEDFENTGFSTGMITGINGTIYPLQNVEYNVLFLDPYVMNLSYEGPFWGGTASCQTTLSPLNVIAFSSGFSGGTCISLTSSNGMFSSAFSSAFIITNQTTPTYTTTTYTTPVNNYTDILYVQVSNIICALGDNLTIYNSVTGVYMNIVTLPGAALGPISLLYNTFDGYIWVLKGDVVYLINPYTQVLWTQVSISSPAFAMDFDRTNGNVYITTSTDVLIYNTGVYVNTITGGGYDIIYNSYNGSMYVTDLVNSVRRINSTTVLDTYIVSGAETTTVDKMIYDGINEAVYFWSSLNLYRIVNNVLESLTSVLSGSDNWMVFNTFINSINISNTLPIFSSFNVNTDVLTSTIPSSWGDLVINYYDGDIYIANQSLNSIVVFTSDGSLRQLITLSANVIKGAYDPDRNSVWFIQPSTNSLIEVKSLISYAFSNTITPSVLIEQPQYGSLDTNYIVRDYLWLHTNDYIRKPRMNYNGGITASLYWKWYSDNVPEFFLFDFSGNQLTTTGLLAYQGPKPLTKIHLNTKANRNIDDVLKPEKQQTVFPIIEHQLSFIDDNDNIETSPEPIEVFIGYNSEDEGGVRSILQLYLKESIDFTINTLNDITNIVTLETIVESNDRYGKISLDIMSNEMFATDSNGVLRGLRPGQNIVIYLSDVSNTRGQYLSPNNGYLVKIRKVYSRTIIVDFFKDIDAFTYEQTLLDYKGTTYLSIQIKVLDSEIGRFNTYAQTEIEDIRYKIELNNVGKIISSDDVYIFNEYDIKEDGIDWVYLNKKRKEMLMMRHMIYPYIGSYKAIINAINYFGYNDLELSEYYRNVDINSSNYLKLLKVEIPDIFDNTVEGWKDNDFIKGTFPNDKYDDTRLFNLTYKITDNDGNNVLTYTLEEVQKKLQGLKYWLQDNIIPLTHKILDITGSADFTHTTSITHQLRGIQIINIKETLTPISFKLNEVYLMPVNNGSTVYNCLLDFYVSRPTGYVDSLPDQWVINIKTYEIYREWYPLKTYSIGERVVYYNNLYESLIDDNRVNNPRKYENVSSWQVGSTYSVSDIVLYDDLFYIYSGYGVTQSSPSIIPPVLDLDPSNGNWLDITEWKKVALTPIQSISETRRPTNLNPFNFTVDSNIDPYIVVEVTSENGWGATYRCKKNYEIKGLLDIQELEAFSNLTSKQYKDSVLGKKYI